MRLCKNNAYPKQKHNYHPLWHRQEPGIVQRQVFILVLFLDISSNNKKSLKIIINWTGYLISNSALEEFLTPNSSHFLSSIILDSIWGIVVICVCRVLFPLLFTDQRLFHIPCPELWVIQLTGPKPLLRNVQRLYQRDLIRLRIFSFGTRQPKLQQACCVSPLTLLSFFLPAQD